MLNQGKFSKKTKNQKDISNRESKKMNNVFIFSKN